MPLLVIGFILLAVGLWEIHITSRTFKQLKTGPLQTGNGFMPWALWISLVIDPIMTVAARGCFAAALLDYNPQ